jgi:hypothetical protein
MKKRYTVFANKRRRAIRASKDYATLRGMDFKKAKDILTKDGFYEHEYGDKDNNNGYAVYRKGNKEVELQYRWVAGKRKGDAHAGKVTNVYVDEDINSTTKVRSLRAIKASGRQLIFPFLVEGEFADGYTCEVGGDSEAECIEKLVNMQDKHGELVWYSGVTDENYEFGKNVYSSSKVRSRRAIRASMNYSDWMESDYSIWIDGQKQTMSKYTTNRYGDHPMIVMPQYNSRTDTLTYVLYIVEDGEMIKIEDQFMSSGEAMEYGETYYEDMLSDSVWNLQHGDVNSAKKITCSYDADDIVMYFNGKKVFTGSVYDLTDTIEELCDDPVILEKFQEWCNEYGDPFDFDGTPRDTAAVFVALIEDEMDYYDGDPDHTFYASGQNGLDFEIFYADQEVGIPD